MHFPLGAFSQLALDELADNLVTTALACENLPDTPFIRSTTWIYATEYEPGKVYVGGKVGGSKVISLEVLVFEGGLDDSAKLNLIEKVTALIGRHARYRLGERVPAYIVIREVPAPNWGVFGERITVESLRTPPEGAKPL